MEKQRIHDGETKIKKKGEVFGESLNMPAKFSIDIFLKVIDVLNQKGQKTTKKNLVEILGKTNREIELARRAIKFHTDIKFIDGERNIAMTPKGIAFITANDVEKKVLLKRELLAFPQYKDIFIKINSEEDRTLKKTDITNFLSKIGGGAVIRREMTKTFSSLCEWAGILEDTGKTVKLKIDLNNEEVPIGASEEKKEEITPKEENKQIDNSGKSIMKSQTPNLEIKIDPTLDPEKLEKQLTILRKFGLI